MASHAKDCWMKKIIQSILRIPLILLSHIQGLWARIQWNRLKILSWVGSEWKEYRTEIPKISSKGPRKIKEQWRGKTSICQIWTSAKVLLFSRGEKLSHRNDEPDFISWFFYFLSLFLFIFFSLRIQQVTSCQLMNPLFSRRTGPSCNKECGHLKSLKEKSISKKVNEILNGISIIFSNK